MPSLVFLYSELMDADLQAELRLPLEFIAFAHIDAKMYTHFGAQSVFAVPHTQMKEWGNTKVYGALFVCKDIELHIETLDAYHVCSRSKLYRNHIKDIHHRIEVEATPIYFDSLDTLARLKYREGGETIEAITYFGNIHHPKIRIRFGRNTSKRLESGLWKRTFKELFGRVASGI